MKTEINENRKNESYLSAATKMQCFKWNNF